MRTTVDIPDHLLKNVKKRAAERGVAFSVVVQDALRGHLSSVPSVKRAPFKLHTVKGRLVDKTLDLDKTSALLLADDEEHYRRD